MQVPNQQKRRQIADTAARLFATQPFHKVRLDDIASEAGVGKGTLYVYFQSKEDLYFSLLYDGFAQLVDDLKTQTASAELDPVATLRGIVEALVSFAFAHPDQFELMRTVGHGVVPGCEAWTAKRTELSQLIEATICRGLGNGAFDDPRPDLTAACIGGMVRSIMLFGPGGLDPQTVSADYSTSGNRNPQRGKEPMTLSFAPGLRPKTFGTGALIACAISAVLAGSGCTVDQKREVSIYRKVLDGKHPEAVNDVFDGKPLSLEEALILANRRNEQLATQGELYVQSLIARDRAFSAFLPTISIGPQISYVDRRSNGSLGNITKQALTDVPLTGGVTLFNGFQNASNLSAASFTIEQRRRNCSTCRRRSFWKSPRRITRFSVPSARSWS